MPAAASSAHHSATRGRAAVSRARASGPRAVFSASSRSNTSGRSRVWAVGTPSRSDSRAYGVRVCCSVAYWRGRSSQAPGSDPLPGEHLPEQVAAVREQRPAGGCPTPRKTLRHPLVGPVTVDCDALDLTGRDQQVVVHTAVCGSSSEEALRLLSVSGTQRMTAPG